VSPERTARQVRWRHLVDEARRSLFVLPAAMVVAAAVLAEALAELDDRIEPDRLPGFLESTQDNARAILGAIAGGTITAAAVVLSFTLVAVQLASSQYSPRTLGRFLADRFQQVVMGVVFGTFTFSIVVLRELDHVGTAAEEPSPQLATTGAVVLAVGALLAVLASIDHTARSLQVESIASRVSKAAIEIARDRFPVLDGPAPPPEPPPEVPADAATIRSPQSGWVQQLSLEAWADVLPAGTSALLCVGVGDHVVDGDPLARVWPAPPDPEVLASRLRGVTDIGPTRTMQDDVAFGLIQLVDIAARALSPAVNDPYTAQEVVLRQGPLLRELLTRDVTVRTVRAGDRTVHPAPSWDADDYLELAVGSLRWHAREQPRVLETLVAELAVVHAFAVDPGPVERQAEVLLSELHRLAPVDADRIRRRAASLGLADGADP